ncbi:MAG TPA: sigma-70 family RNA polymerase sigma factor [Ktedonobacterales bacterium]|nr:sigma-70 family RNA polymerase sigma factor [Ktedonobacterales bacterium]
MSARSDKDEREWLAQQFEAQRTHLRSVAYRLLGSPSEADDAVQESWLRLSRSDTSGIENLGGWLTTVVARVSLDMLRSRATRREESLSADRADEEYPLSDPILSREGGSNPEDEALLADSVGLALLVVLETLTPAERLAFVMHDVFSVPFDEIAGIVGRSPTAARQLASRARRRVQGVAMIPDADFTQQRAVVDAFLAASRGGDFGALLALLDPDVVLRVDGAAADMGALGGIRGAETVARQFAGRAQVARMALMSGAVGAVWAPGGEPRVIFSFTLAHGKIVAIDLIADPERLRQLAPTILDG